MERKVSRGLGERSDEEKQQLQARIVDLEKYLEINVTKRKSLLQQCKKVQLELQAWKRRKDNAEKEHKDIKGKIAEIELETSSCGMSLKQVISMKEEAMVTHDVIRLDVRRLRDTLRKKAEDVFALENQREQLELSMAEKKVEMKVYSEVRTAQLRAAEEERHKSAVELGQRSVAFEQVISMKEEAMVTHDVIRLDVRRLRDTLRKKAEDVFALENQREQLELSMAEKKVEMKVYSEVRTAQLRAAEEERHKSAVELGQRSVAFEKLQSKYEMLCKAHRSGDADGEEHSQVYYLIMAAQKREELQREGDNLDGKIRKKEKEMKAMEKTLAHLQQRNSQYRISFHKADMNSDATKGLSALDEKLRISEKHLFEQKKKLRYLENESEENQQRLEILNQQKVQLTAENEHMKAAKQQVVSEVETHQKNAETAMIQSKELW